MKARQWNNSRAGMGKMEELKEGGRYVMQLGEVQSNCAAVMQVALDDDVVGPRWRGACMSYTVHGVLL